VPGILNYDCGLLEMVELEPRKPSSLSNVIVQVRKVLMRTVVDAAGIFTS